MKTTLTKIFRCILLVAAVSTAATLTARASTTTYYQVKGKQDCTAIKIEGIASYIEIGYEPQFAFPGKTLDEINHYTLITELDGGEGDNTITARATAWGLHPQRHKTNDSVDVLAYQFGTSDGGQAKAVVFVLTNGDGGVYVQKFGWCYHSTALYYNRRMYGLDGSNASFAKAQTAPTGSGTSGGYKAWGLRIHGVKAVPDSSLAFPGATLEDLKDCAFVAGFRMADSLDNPVTNNWAAFKTCWTNSNDKLAKIVMQFEASERKKTAIIQLVDGEGGVYASQPCHSYDGTANAQKFAIDASGNVTKSNGSGGNSSGEGSYSVSELYAIPQCVPKYPNKIKVFSDPSKTLTLDDIEEGDFTARMYGGYVNAAFNAVDSAKGYNKKVFRDDDTGNVTNIVVEFSVRDGSTKCLVASFENGADGVYASGLGTKNSSSAIGYVFYERAADGTETWYGSNPNSNPANCYAATWKANGYGVCDLRVTIPLTWTLDADRTWSELRNGAALSADDIVKIRVADPAAVLTVDEDATVGKIEFVDASCAQLVVASGKTLTAEDITGAIDILNNGTLVKSGSGTVAWPFNRDSAGETVVSNGTLKAASQTGSGTSHVVRVKDGATFDINGVGSLTTSVVLEEGAFFVNRGGGIGNTTAQTGQLTLDGDAAVTAGGNFGLLLPGYAATLLELGSNTLTFNGTAAFWLVETTITGDGTINVESGTLQCARANTTGANCTLNIGASGALRIDGTKTLCVSNFYNGGTLYNGNNYGGTAYGTLLVNGTLTPGNAMTNITLADGATVKATGTAQVVSETFSASGTITVDASEIDAETLQKGDVAVLTVPADQVPPNVEWPPYSPIKNVRTKWMLDGDGKTKTLYFGKVIGLKLIIR